MGIKQAVQRGARRARQKASEPAVRQVLLNAAVTLVVVVLLGGYVQMRFNDQSEKSKTLLALMRPEIKQRRAVYLRFRQTARDAHRTVDLYFPSGRPDRWDQFQELERCLGLDVPRTGQWATQDAVLAQLKNLITLRESQEYLAASGVKKAEDKLLDALFRQLRDARGHMQDKAYLATAHRRMDAAFDELEGRLTKELRSTALAA